MSTMDLVQKLRYMGRQYAAGQEARGGERQKHYLEEAADELERLAGFADVPEGCTPEDARVLRRANHKLAQTTQELLARAQHAEDVVEAAKERIGKLEAALTGAIRVIQAYGEVLRRSDTPVHVAAAGVNDGIIEKLDAILKE